jgi:hypothetical protein
VTIYRYPHSPASPFKRQDFGVDPSLFEHKAEWELWIAICEIEGRDPGPKPERLKE